jgi:hypothetical protein
MPPSAQGKPENVPAAQAALLKRAKANSDAQQGKYEPSAEDKAAAQVRASLRVGLACACHARLGRM